MENGTKLRLLYLYQYLFRRSDAEHPISTPQIMKYLKEEHGIDVNRTTLPNDFAMMEEAGFHFSVNRSRQNQYYFDDRLFTMPELKLLIDAVSSSRFITEKKSREMIRKLESLASDFQAEKLRRHVTAEGRVKADNEKVFLIVDALNEAIDTHSQVRFQMENYNMTKRRSLRNKGEFYVVSPYALVWDGDNYYLVGYCHNRSAMRHFRADRIRNVPDLLEDPAVPEPAGFSLAEYSRKVFRMFGSDETAVVELLCGAELMDGVIDQFGTGVKTKIVDEEHFVATVSVAPSPTFFRWVFGWGGRMKILSPRAVRDDYRAMVKKALEE